MLKRKLKKVIWKPHKGSQELFLSCPADEVLIGGNRGGGKAQPLDCEVQTPYGPRKMGDIEVGALVLNPDGTNSTVIGVYPQGKQTVYKIEFSDSSVTYCTAEHLWYGKVANRNKSKHKDKIYSPLNFSGYIYSTEQLIKKIQDGNNFLIPCPEAVSFNSIVGCRSKHNFDPYLLGLLLGDGSLSRKEVSFSTSDQELLDYVRKFGFGNDGDTVNKRGQRCVNSQIKRDNPLYDDLKFSKLRGCTSSTKFIPIKYLYASIEDRLALVQGLMDTDGEACDGKVYYSSTSYQLIKDLRFLIHSLGGWATVCGGKLGHRLKYRKAHWPKGVYKETTRGWGLYIRFPEQKQLFRLQRKRDIAKNYMHGRLVRKIVNIQEVGKEECQCIKVNNPNGLYLTDDFVVTHNTDALLMDYLQHVGQGFGADWRGILFREEYTQLTDIINKSKKWIHQIFPDAKYNNSQHKWSFATGEELYLRYIKTMTDYYSYHGHEYSVSANSCILLPGNSTKKAKDVKVGDLVQTLQGPRKVVKVLRYTKPGVTISVSDEDSGSIMTQQQGLIHPLLTNAGWQRIGLSYLSQTYPQSLAGKALIKEVSQFLFGIHQEILFCCSYWRFHTFQGSSIYQDISKWYSCLFQIYVQFLHWINLSPLAGVFRLYGFQGLLDAIYFDEVVLETSYIEYIHEHLEFLQLALYCENLIVHVHLIQKFCVHQMQSILLNVCGVPSLQEILKYSENQQYHFVRQLGHLQLFLFYQLYTLHTFLNDTFSCVRLLMNIVPDCQDSCLYGCGQDGGLLLRVLESGQFSFPLQNDVLEQSLCPYNMDVQDTLPGCTLGFDTSFFYNHPYTHEFCCTEIFSSLKSFSVSAFEPLLEMVDFEVEGENHYISLITNNITNSQCKSVSRYLVNQNCWIGWEELTNWATDECYLAMMSCNRSSNPNVPRKYRATCNPSGSGHCVPFGEVLTPTGWVDISDVHVGDEVFTVDQNGTLLVTTVDQIHKEYYSGELKELDIRGSYLCCTPKHKMPKLGGVVGDRTKLYTLLEVDKLPGQASILRTVSWVGTPLPDTITIPKYNIPGRRKSKKKHKLTIKYKDYLKLLGWFLSEGDTIDRDKCFTISKSYSTHPEQYKEIDDLLSSCGFDRESDNLVVYSADWWNHFKQFGSYTTKYIPKHIKNATVPELRILFNTLMRGDGSWKKLNMEQPSGTYWTASKQLADDISEIALKLGYKVRCEQRMHPHQRFTCYSVHFNSVNTTTLYTGSHRYAVSTVSNRKNVHDKHYSGNVYCIGVKDTHTFILRQNGSVWISGNSWVKSRFIDPMPPLTPYEDKITGKVRVYIPSSLSENKTLLEADPDYLNTIIAATQDDPIKYKAWVLGEWDIVVGGFFSDVWDTAIHVLPSYIKIPESWIITRSFDWGSTKPWAVTYCAECNGEQPLSDEELPYMPKGSIIVVDELYGWTGVPDEGDQATSDVIAERVLAKDEDLQNRYGCKVIAGPADITIFEVRDGTSIAHTMRKYGLFWTKAYKGPGSRVSGWSLIRTMLGAAKRKDLEYPHLYFTTNARHHIRTLPLLQMDKKRPEDIDTTLEDHCGDSLRYNLTRKANKLTRRKVRI